MSEGTVSTSREQPPVFTETDNTRTNDRRNVPVYKDSSVVEFMSIKSSAQCSGYSQSMTGSRALANKQLQSN